jgi:hypothetical protein
MQIAFGALIETPTPPGVTTLEGKIKKIKQLNTQIYIKMRALHTQAFNQVWRDKDLTPKQIIEGFGTDAAALFQNSSQIQTILATVDPDYVPLAIPEGYTVTFNDNGSATVTEPTLDQPGE